MWTDPGWREICTYLVYGVSVISSEFLFKFLSSIRLFQLIWSEILHNGQKYRSKVPLSDVMTILLVTRRVFWDVLYIQKFLKYVEKGTAIWQWHTKLGTITKNIEYLGVILIQFKRQNMGAKVFPKIRKRLKT